jgi:O-6-methylguanine DNA methyltransferase
MPTEERRRRKTRTPRKINSASAFTARVLSAVRRIPPGHVATYGDVAALAGKPRAARAVGNIMRDCRRPDVPCHRVIAAGGRLGGYGGSEVLKRSLLVAEGVPVSGSRVRELDRVLWKRPRPERGAGGKRREAVPPSESERGWGPASTRKKSARKR